LEGRREASIEEGQAACAQERIEEDAGEAGEMKRVVELVHDGRIYFFHVDDDPPLAFWRVETEGRKPWRSPMRVMGNESPEFFHGLARRWDEQS
jgi:hypothetical protein